MDCCAPKQNSAARLPCPGCGHVGRPVSGVTVEAILDPAHAARLVDAEPRFCPTHTCDVLYYGDDGQSAHKQEARVRVGLKESQDPRPVCYCFGFSRADIVRELAETGSCTVAPRISAEIKAGHCACETKNPAGSCCLGEVNHEIKASRLRQAPAARTGSDPVPARSLPDGAHQ